MPVPDFVLELRRHVGHGSLWLPGLTAVVRRGDELLLVRRSDNGQWSPVTGIVDPGEHPAAAAVREVREETGVRAQVERLALVSVTAPVVHANGDRAQYLDHTFTCRYVSGTAHVGDDESTEVAWFGVDRLPPMRPHLRERIRVALAPEVRTLLGPAPGRDGDGMVETSSGYHHDMSENLPPNRTDDADQDTEATQNAPGPERPDGVLPDERESTADGGDDPDPAA